MVLTDIVRSRLMCLKSYFILNGGDIPDAIGKFAMAFNLNKHEVIRYTDYLVQQDNDFRVAYERLTEVLKLPHEPFVLTEKPIAFIENSRHE